MSKIIPHLWYDNQAEEAAAFYCSIFRNSRIVDVARYGDAGAEVSGRPKGSVMTVTFEIEGQQFVALNGGPHFKFSPAISFMVDCASQREIDEMWDKLSAGGAIEQCGWLRDKFGVSWQIVPVAAMNRMMQAREPQKLERVWQTMLQMKKLDIETLEQAYAQG